jgi:hypothetical protein
MFLSNGISEIIVYDNIRDSVSPGLASNITRMKRCFRTGLEKDTEG